MISTVTTSTVSSITSAALFGTLGAIGIVILLTLLVQKELVSTSNDLRLLRLQRTLNIAIYPLIVVFLLIFVTKIIEVI
jgi:hypothetical protein